MLHLPVCLGVYKNRTYGEVIASQSDIILSSCCFALYTLCVFTGACSGRAASITTIQLQHYSVISVTFGKIGKIFFIIRRNRITCQ